MKHLFAAALLLSALSAVETAHAAIVTYDFTAVIDNVVDPNNLLKVKATSTKPNGKVKAGTSVSGTFSYDDSLNTTPNTAVALYLNGDITTDRFEVLSSTDSDLDLTALIADGSDLSDELYIIDGESVGLLSVAGRRNDFRFGDFTESVSFSADGNLITREGLGSTVSLAGFSDATYTVELTNRNGRRLGYASGAISGVTLRGGQPSTVPELSAGDAAGSLALLTGGALVLSSRRRGEED